jgi:hypothetical protein
MLQYDPHTLAYRSEWYSSDNPTFSVCELCGIDLHWIHVVANFLFCFSSNCNNDEGGMRWRKDEG